MLEEILENLGISSNDNLDRSVVNRLFKYNIPPSDDEFDGGIICMTYNNYQLSHFTKSNEWYLDNLLTTKTTIVRTYNDLIHELSKSVKLRVLIAMNGMSWYEDYSTLPYNDEDYLVGDLTELGVDVNNLVTKLIESKSTDNNNYRVLSITKIKR